MKTAIAFIGVIGSIYLAVIGNNLLVVSDTYEVFLSSRDLYFFRGSALTLLILALAGGWFSIQIYRQVNMRVLISIFSVAIISGLVIYFLPDLPNIKNYIATCILLAVSLLTLFEVNEPDADYF